MTKKEYVDKASRDTYEAGMKIKTINEVLAFMRARLMEVLSAPSKGEDEEYIYLNNAIRALEEVKENVYKKDYNEKGRHCSKVKEMSDEEFDKFINLKNKLNENAEETESSL